MILDYLDKMELMAFVRPKGCGIAHCRRLIVDELQKIFPEYIKKRKLLKSFKLKEKTEPKINRYIDILIPKCENYESSVIIKMNTYLLLKK